MLCPNEEKCVGNIKECISPPNNCSIEKPFKCKVNGVETCVRSLTNCDYPSGFIIFKIMNYCVPENRIDMCPYFKNTYKICRRYGEDYEIKYDGICRPKSSHSPNQRVCIIGQVLCPDLSCRDNYNECILTDYRPGNKVRCLGQQIVSDD